MANLQPCGDGLVHLVLGVVGESEAELRFGVGFGAVVMANLQPCGDGLVPISLNFIGAAKVKLCS